MRSLNPKLDCILVEGPDDGAVVNALIRKHLGIDLARPGQRLVQTKEEGGGVHWALRAFEQLMSEAQAEARIGVVIDRDGTDGRPDNWPAVRALLRRYGSEIPDPQSNGLILAGRFGIWMWPDNVSVGGDLEDFVSGIIPTSPVLSYATEACRAAKEHHGAEYHGTHARKAALKVRSIWRDASTAGGYGHLIRDLPIVNTPASIAFIAWFEALFLR